jgi:predicted transcriptional regulator
MSAEVLKVAMNPIGKTRLMFKSGIHMRQLEPVLKRLVDKQLIHYNESSKTYSTSSRGQEFLEMYYSMTKDVNFIKIPAGSA